MILLTNEQMKKADAYTIDTLGAPASLLMERAGTALYLEALDCSGQVLVVCGGGNNGGDGLVCARKLIEKGRQVQVVLLAECKTKEAKEKYEALQVAIANSPTLSQGVITSVFPEKGEGQFSLVVDCIFGTGFLPRGGEDVWFDAINAYKEKGAYILSADLPSGLSDEGKIVGGCVVADKTICFGYQKSATVLCDGLDVCGEVVIADIGIQLPEKCPHPLFLVGHNLVQSLVPKRKRNTHKGSYGRAAIVGGSRQYTGAAHLAILACVKGGAGYSTLYTDEELLPVYYLNPPEALFVGCNKQFCEEDYLSLLDKTSIGFGVGATNGEKTEKLLRYLLTNYTGKLVIDADGLNALAGLDQADRAKLLEEKKCEVVLTPHIGEFKRLLGEKGEIKDILCVAKDFAKENKVVLVLKSASTIITDGEVTYLSTAGNAGQAKGGSGDVLTGLMTALLATKDRGAIEGAVAAVYLAGMAAEIAAEKMGEETLTASDVIAHFGEAFLRLHR